MVGGKPPSRFSVEARGRGIYPGMLAGGAQINTFYNILVNLGYHADSNAYTEDAKEELANVYGRPLPVSP